MAQVVVTAKRIARTAIRLPAFLDVFADVWNFWSYSGGLDPCDTITCAEKYPGKFKGGKINQRDRWYGFNDPDFQRWWHRNGKEDFGGADLASREAAREAYEYWIEIGSPRVR